MTTIPEELQPQAAKVNKAFKRVNDCTKSVADATELLDVAEDQLVAAKSYLKREERIYQEMVRAYTQPTTPQAEREARDDRTTRRQNESGN